MACGCGCNGAANGCGEGIVGLNGFGAVTVPVQSSGEIDGWLQGMLPMILLGGLGLYFLWRR